MKANDFLGQYQMMEQYGVTSAEEVKVENLADHLRIEITAAGTVCATPCCRTMTRRAAGPSAGSRPVSRARDLPIAVRCRGWRHLREPGSRAYDRCDIGGFDPGIPFLTLCA